MCFIIGLLEDPSYLVEIQLNPNMNKQERKGSNLVYAGPNFSFLWYILKILFKKIIFTKIFLKV